MSGHGSQVSTTQVLKEGFKISFGSRLGHILGEGLEAVAAGLAAWSFTAGWHYFRDKVHERHAETAAASPAAQATPATQAAAQQALEVIGRFGEGKDLVLADNPDFYIIWMEFETWLRNNERHSYEDMLLRSRHLSAQKIAAAIKAVAMCGRGNFPAMRQELRSRELTEHCREQDYLGAEAAHAAHAAEQKFEELKRWLQYELPQVTRRHKSSGYGRFVEAITR